MGTFIAAGTSAHLHRPHYRMRTCQVCALHPGHFDLHRPRRAASRDGAVLATVVRVPPLCLFVFLSIKTMLNGGKQETNSSVAYLYLLLVVIVIVSS